MSEGNGQKLPSGWLRVPMRDLLILAPTVNPKAKAAETFSYIDIEAVDNRLQRVALPREIAGAAAPSRARNEVVAGDVIFSLVRPYLKNIAIIPGGLISPVASTAFFVCRPGKGMDSRFLWNFLRQNSFIESIVTYGNSPPSARDDEFERLLVPVAPQAEQVRIADKLDELLSDLDAGVKALEGVRAKLKQYRAAVLKAAVEGTLTAATLSNVVQLSQLILGLGQGWSPRCELTRAPRDEEWAIIKTTAVQSMRYLDHEAKPLPEGLLPRPHIEIKPGDILMTRKGPRQRAGVACYVRATRHRLMICDTVYRFTCRNELVEPRYLEIALNSPTVVAEIDSKKSGINDSGVSLTHKKLGEISIRLPSLAAQVAIVEAVETQLSVVDHLEADIAAKLKSAAALRQSILKCALEGKLVPQAPSDEPASELLKRIAAERAERERLTKQAKQDAKKPMQTTTAGATVRRGRKPKTQN